MKKIFGYFKKSQTPEFIPILQEYFAHKAKGLKDATLEKHGYYYSNLYTYFKEQGMLNMEIGEVRIKHMEQFRQWLFERKKCSLGHASRHIEHCQAAFNYAIMMEYYDRNPISPIECQRDTIDEPVSLTDIEIKKVMSSEFTSPAWKLVTDLFLFQCFTGLSYIDLWLYSIESERAYDPDGKRITVQWVTSSTGRGKNNKPYSAELNEYAKAIHDKYAGKFTEITNQAYNRIIKRIAFSLNINKDLSSHNARKTYATLRWIQGRSLESIAYELGNSPEMTRRRYITPSRERVRQESIRLKDVPFLRFT